MKKKNEQSKTDLVCGMDLTGFSDVIETFYNKKAFYFCGKICKDKFGKNPKKFQKDPLIKLENVQKAFKIGEVKIEILRGLSLYVWEGDFIVIIGASGSGKSTVLNMIGLLDAPTSGKVFLKGKNVSLLKDEEKADLRSKTFGFIFQQYNLIPWLTAYENITLPLIFSEGKIEINKLETMFQKIGLKERMNHRPFELSGGEQQRVALLRALTNNPEIILGDEPTGNLDSENGSKILEMLIDLNKTQEKTLIIVTHDAGVAEKADQIIVIKDGQITRDHHFNKKIYTR